MKAFPPFRLDSGDGTLWRGSERVSLTPKAFDLLRYLVDRPGRLIAQDELLDALWHETYVQPEVLRKHVLEIRKALGDDPREPRFIETQPKRGYRFIAAVTEQAPVPVAHPLPEAVMDTPALTLVGRERELALLSQNLERAFRGQRQLVFVTGEAGIGKTSLLDAFEQQLPRQGRVLSARGQSVEGFGGKEAYYPVLDALAQLTRGPGATATLQTLATVAPTWLVQFPSLVKPEQRESLQREILGSTRERMVREICEALETLSAATPLVLMLEDLHWADHSTFDLISALARRRGPARLMLVGTYRPVDVILSASALKGLKQDLLIHRLCQEIALERLSESDVTRYLVADSALSGLPNGLDKLIHRHSGGNPLFMVAIVEHLVEKGILVHEDGGWALTMPLDRVDPGVPETLQRMLEIQLDPLDEESASILRAASIMGQRFWTCGVASMLDRKGETVEAICEALAARQQFIRHCAARPLLDDALSTGYEFRHSLYREFLHRRLPTSLRSKLHRKLADDWEVRVAASRAVHDPSVYAELAMHFEEGQDFARAIRYLKLAAHNAARRSAHREAIEILRHALELAPPAEESSKRLAIELHLAIADGCYALGAMDKSSAECGMAADIAGAAGLGTEQVTALLRQTRPIAFFDPEGCYALCERAIEISTRIGDELLRCRAQISNASWRVMMEGFEHDDIGASDQAMARIRELGAEESIAADLGHYAHIQCLRSEYLAACRTAEACLKSLSGTTSLWDYLTALAGYAFCLLHVGNLGGAAGTLKKGLEIAQKNGNEPWIAIFQAALGWLEVILFDFETARELCENMVDAGVRWPYEHAWMRSVTTLGMAELAAGNARHAVELFQRVIDWKAEFKFFLSWYWLRLAHYGSGMANLALGNFDQANAQTDVLLAKAGPDCNLRSLAWTTKAHIALAERNIQRAQECVANALQALAAFDVPIASWRAHEAAWLVCLEQSDHEAAEVHRAKAAATIRQLADTFEPGERSRDTLLSAPQVRRILGQSGRVSG